MSDTWGTVPYSIFDDERLDGDDGPDRTFMVMILSLTDDRGRFEGSIDALCRRTGCSKKYVQERLESVKRRELIDLYQVEGRARPVGEVIRFHLLPGLPDTKRFEAKRRESAFPARDGTVEPSRRDKAKARGASEAKPKQKRGSDVEVAPTTPVPSVEAVAQDCGSDVEAMWRTDREREEREKRRETDTARAPVSASPPPWTPPPWPTPEHERAAERFIAAIRERTGRPAPYLPSALAELAAEHSAHFVAAVAEAERLGVAWKGWHVQQPRNWLRTLCAQAAEESQKSRAPRPHRNANGSVYKPFDPALYPSTLTPEELAEAAGQGF